MPSTPVLRLAEQIGKPGGGFWGWLAVQIMIRRTRNLNDWTLAALDIQPADHILEIGFGPGVTLAQAVRLASEGFVAGIDHSEHMVRRAARAHRAAIQAGRVEVRQGDAAVLLYDQGRFDKVFSVGLIYYLPDPAAALRDMRRVLKPGGRLLIVVREPEELAKNKAFVAKQARAYSGEELLALLTGAGFAQARIERIPPDGIGAIGEN